MIFGIDYDNTFSADPKFFHEFLDLVKKHGHHAIMITYSRQHTKVFEDTKGRINVIYAGKELKDVAARDAGYIVNVWIDDMPELIKEQPLIIFPKPLEEDEIHE